MNPDTTFRRVTQATAGVVFLLLGALLATGYGGLGQYRPFVRWTLAGVIVLYGVIRVRGAVVRRSDEFQN